MCEGVGVWKGVWRQDLGGVHASVKVLFTADDNLQNNKLQIHCGIPRLVNRVH